MAKAEEVLTQLATRIPKDLHRRPKLYCVMQDTMLQHFVTEAIAEKLGRKRDIGEKVAGVVECHDNHDESTQNVHGCQAGGS